MKAACPHCFDNTISKSRGCDSCRGTGFVEAQFAKGVIFEPHCRECPTSGFGFAIREDGTPPKEEDVGGVPSARIAANLCMLGRP